MRLFVGVLGAALLAGSSGPSKVDVNGTWEAKLDYKTCTSQNADSRGCGYLLSLGGGEVFTLSQSGSDVTGTVNLSGVTLKGRLDGLDLRLDGSGTNISGTFRTQQWRLRVSGDRLTGTFAESKVGQGGIPDTNGTWTSESTADVTATRQK